MRILHVIRSANPAGGGPIEAIAQLGLQHQRQGRHVEVATLDDPGAAWLADFPLPVHALGPALGTYGFTTKLPTWLRRNVAAFDIVVVNGLWQYPGLAVWRALRHGTVPYVVFPHGMLDPWFKRHYPLKHLKKWMYWPWAEYRILRDAAGVCFTSEEERIRARGSFGLYRCRELEVGYGTARPPAPGPEARAQFFAKFPAARDARLLLFFGRLHEKKGCDLLIKAFGSLVRADDSPWRLVLAGPVARPAYERGLAGLVRRHCAPGTVIRTGMLRGDLKWGAFQSADAFVLPSHQENFGVAVAEALGSGVPVLLSNKVNIWREIVKAEAGFVAEDDEPGTRQLLTRWMALPDEQRTRMRSRAGACFEQFDAAVVAHRIGETFEGLRRRTARPRAYEARRSGSAAALSTEPGRRTG